MMEKTYKIEIKELLSMIIEIKAMDIEEAISKASKMYEKEEIILGSEDFISFEIDALTE
ncbi:MAG: DpnD/PcfM family protein [Balneolaceae bacterium]